MTLFEADFLTRLEYLSLVAKKVFQGETMAQRRTRRIGSGIEFADHQQYVPGDDFRYLDWNLFARHSELMLKRFHEEEDLHVYVLLDVSRSMSVGRCPKIDLARQLAAAVSYIALSNLDRVAVCAFSDSVTDEFPLTRGKGRILPLLNFLTELQCAEQQSSLLGCAESFVEQSRRRGLVVLISDLFDPNGFETGINLLRHQGFEVNLIQIYDEQDQDPGLLGDVEITDAETSEIRPMTVTEGQLKRYRAAFETFEKSVAQFSMENELSLTVARSDQKFDAVMQRMIRPESVERYA